MRRFGPNDVSFFYLKRVSSLQLLTWLLTNILFSIVLLSICWMLYRQFDMSGYSLCQHKCRQTLCRQQHYMGPTALRDLGTTIRVKCLAQGHKKCHKDFGTSWTWIHAGQSFMYSESDAQNTVPRLEFLKCEFFACICGALLYKSTLPQRSWAEIISVWNESNFHRKVSDMRLYSIQWNTHNHTYGNLKTSKYTLFCLYLLIHTIKLKTCC